jgi:hypothetical protein
MTRRAPRFEDARRFPGGRIEVHQIADAEAGHGPVEGRVSERER